MLTNPVFSSLLESSLDLSSRQQLKKKQVGLVYSTYRIVIAIFFSINFFLVVRNHPEQLWLWINILPTFGYFFASLLLLSLYYFLPKNWLLMIGFILDLLVLSIMLYFNNSSDLQITLMFLVVVAASFMLLNTSQAVLLTALACSLVIYQQFFQELPTSLNYSLLSNAGLMLASFVIVANLSYLLSKRLTQIEILSERQTGEVNALNAINQQVVKIIEQGVVVLTHQLEILMANDTAVAQLRLKSEDNSFFLPFLLPNLADILLPIINRRHHEFVFRISNSEPNNEILTYTSYRIRLTQLGNEYALLLIEDLRREQAHAQQLKLASLGQLTASIAHEIRNPLAAISQASQLLLEDAQDPDSGLSEDDAQLYEMIYKQTIRVNQIIEDVLKLSRQEKPVQTLIQPKTWLPTFIKENFSSHDVFLHCHTSYGILFDVYQLEQVLTNLINNGLRFSSKVQPHAYVTIEVQESESQVHISVIDTGAGVKPEDVPNLFNPFFTTDHQGGTGLGLYLSQAFCQANQAYLYYVPNHKHTCFRISFLKQDVPNDSEFVHQ